GEEVDPYKKQRCLQMSNAGRIRREMSCNAGDFLPSGVYEGVGKGLGGDPINKIARGGPGPYGGTPKMYTTYVGLRPCD
ncbi:MAG: hypothetical protein ABWK05_08205, partial [Pyrobaculum sp.]